MITAFAEGTAATTASGGAGGALLSLVMTFLPFILIFYFLILRPQKKQQKRVNDMLAGLQVGDEITTIGGIIGKVISIKEETCVIETSRDCTKIRILKSAVSRIDVKAEDAKD